MGQQHFHSTQAEHSHSSMKGRCSDSSAFSPLTPEKILQEEQGHLFLTLNNLVLILFVEAANGMGQAVLSACVLSAVETAVFLELG